MTGGWVSNLLDRLGIHHWTAPGSVRGVVDFMHIGAHYYNVADFFIIGCTPLFLLAAGLPGRAGGPASGHGRQPSAVGAKPGGGADHGGVLSGAGPQNRASVRLVDRGLR